MDDRYNGKMPGVLQVSILFSVVIFLFVFIGYRVQNQDFYSGILISEFGLIMLPALIFLLLFRYDLRIVIRLKGTSPLNFFVTFFLMLFAIPVAGIFNLLNLLIVNSVFGKIIVNQPPAANNAAELLVNILVIAGSAGLCEEFLFRGVIQRGFERFNTVRAILLAALLFSLTHMDFQKIFGTFLLGALIGFIVYRTDSLLCGMFAHFTNNALVVVIGYASMKFMSAFEGSGMRMPEETNLDSIISTLGSMPPQQLTIVLYVYGFIFAFLVSMFMLLLFALIKLNPAGGRNAAELHVAQAAGLQTTRPQAAGTQATGLQEAGLHGNSTLQPGAMINNAPAASNTPELPSCAMPGPGKLKGNAKGLLWLLPGLLLIAGIYYFEVLHFNGVATPLVETVRRILGMR